MLEVLRIRHLALIDDMELEFAPGMNVLTGETGAGKSFILKALNFLTGEKMQANLVRPGEKKAQVEALFALPEGDLIVRRELVAETGRSRLYINDKLSSQEAIKALKPSLLVHTSQHGQQKLLQPAFQAKLLDDFLNRAPLVDKKNELVTSLKELGSKHAALLERSKQLADKREFLEFQRQEIDKVAPEAGEEDTLEAKKQELRNQSNIQDSIDTALSCISSHDGGVLDGISHLERALDSLQRILPDYNEDYTAVLDFRSTIQDLEGRLRRQPLTAPGEDSLEEIESRLFALAQLKRKLRRSLDEIVDLQQEVEENLNFLDACELDIAQLKKQEVMVQQELRSVLEELNPARKEAGLRLCAAIVEELKGLGFSEHVQVHFAFAPVELAPDCIEDRPHLMWVPNPGQSAQPLDKIASGGELSRFLLAVVGLMNRNDTPTLIFDEVDAGVGGITLNYVAEALNTIANRQQMLLITHWPQLAARAKQHFFVKKEVLEGATYTRCSRLEQPAIFDEISRMAGGGGQGEAMAQKLLTTTI